MTVALEGGEWSAARPGRTLPPGKTRHPFYRRLGGPQGRSGRAENFVPTGIRSRTIQPVVSRYTDWATRPTKVKCTLVQALRLCTGRTARRGSRGIALLFLDHGTRRGWVVNSTPWPHFTPGKDPVPILQQAGWAPGPVQTGAEYFAPTEIRSRTVQPVASHYTDWATRPTIRAAGVLSVSVLLCYCALIR